MPRIARIVPGEMIFHVLNRGNARSQIFEHDRDYDALERVMVEVGVGWLSGSWLTVSCRINGTL